MKICFTVDSMASGGAERVVSILANNLAKRGHDVYILMISSLEEISFYDLDSVKLICLMKNCKKKIRTFKRIKLLKASIEEIMPDVVISFLPHVTIYTYFALRRTSIKLICSERNDPSKLDFKYKILLKYIFRRCSGNVFQTEDAKKWYGKNISKNCIRIPNPINPDISYQKHSKRSNTIITVGRLVPQKNIYLLIDSFSLFCNNDNNSKYILKIYGNGPLLDDLKEYAVAKCVSKNVMFLGNSKTWFVNDGDAKMFILASNFEGMPNALMEAMASGIPCISTDCPVGGPKELIVDGVNGLLVPVNDANKLLGAMNKISNSEFAEELSLQNKSLASKYSEKTVTDNWLEFIKQVIKG